MDIAIEAPAGAARALLRDTCRGVHARLDERLSGFSFDDATSYADMLARMAGPVARFEYALSGVAPNLFPDWRARRRTIALRADLAAFGVKLPRVTAPLIVDEAEAFGVMYVLEGSRLGGAVLARRAAQSSDLSVRRATRFFRHGEGVGFWRGFLMGLERSSAVRARPERATAAALNAFASFEDAFR